MNTSDNKERIIEIGWMNVVKNIFGSFFNQRGSNDPIPTISNDIEMKTTNTERKLDKGQNKETFNITLSNHEKDKNKSTTFSKLEVVYDEQPSTSGLLKSKITRKEKYQTNSYQLISKMLTCIEVEEQYIKYFRAYLSYREAYNEEKSDLDLDMPPIDDKKDEYGLITSKSKRKGFPKIRLSSSTEKISNSASETNSIKINNDTTLKFKEEYSERVLQRKEILNKLLSENMNDENFGLLIEDFIDLEENFIL